MAYSKSDAVGKIEEALKDPIILYGAKFVDYKEVIGNDWYTEVVAQELLKEENIAILRNIPKITLNKNYKTNQKQETISCEKPSNIKYNRELLAKELYGKTLNYIGEVLDFATPLENASDSKVIDLLTYNKIENTAYINVLKKSGSSATLLKCIIQAYICWKIVDGEKLLSNFGINSANLRKSVLVFKSSTAYGDLHDKKCVAVRGLMSHLGIDLFVLNSSGTDLVESYKY